MCSERETLKAMAVYDFAQHDEVQSDLRRFRVDRFILSPKHWSGFSCQVTLKWHRVRFSESSAADVPNDKRGVYTFVAVPGIADHPACHYLLYVGMVYDSDFRTRFRSYLQEGRKSKPRDHIRLMIERWPDHLWFYYAELANGSIIKKLEGDLITAYLPPHNRSWPTAIRTPMNLVFT
jgi:hypothetical protein